MKGRFPYFFFTWRGENQTCLACKNTVSQETDPKVGTPKQKDGKLDIQYPADPALINGLNSPGVFTGGIFNRGNIGKTSEELYMEWNEDYPDDQVKFSAN